MAKADMRPRRRRSPSEATVAWVLIVGTLAWLAWAVAHAYGV